MHLESDVRRYNLLGFGTVFIKSKLVPKRVGFFNILNKVQIVELVDKYFYNSSLE
jgi:hypothetical protein